MEHNQSLRDVILSVMNEPALTLMQESEELSTAESIALSLVQKARSGDLAAVKYLNELLEEPASAQVREMGIRFEVVDVREGKDSGMSDKRKTAAKV